QLPHLLDLRDPAGQEEHVQRPVADHLVGDARAGALRVAGDRRDRSAYGHQPDSSRVRKESADCTVAPVACTRSTSQRSEVTTRTVAGSPSPIRRRTISSSAESRRGLGACATSITLERIGGRGGCPNLTVTCSPPGA